MQHIFEKINHKQQRGFTLVEMLVVAPLFVLVIAVVIGFMLGLVGDSITANTRTRAVYDVQNALTQIERDSFLGTQYMNSYVPHSPQGKDDGVAGFNAAAGDIIMNQYGTTSDPTDPARSVVYYANQPQACSGQYQANQPFFVKVVYFLRTETDGSKSLYRRMIVPLNNQYLNNSNGDTTCGVPWQRSSCKVQNLSDPRCQAKDMLLLTNVTSFTTTYYNKSNPSLALTDPTIADSLRVAIAVSKSVAGKSVTQTASVTSSRTNNADPTPKPPTTPVISLLNPTSDTYNNPVLTTFQWTSTGVTQYSYTYQVNGGAWSTPVVTSGTNIGVTTPYSNVPITLSVTAMNDNGSSTAQYLYTTPLWTIPTLQNNWGNYTDIYPTSGYATVGYTKTSAGIVLLKGLIQRSNGSPNVYETIAMLPVGCRPAESYIFLAGGVSAPDRVDIKSDGTIMYETGGAAFMSLEGIAFIPAVAPYVWTAPALQNGWQDYYPIGGPTGFVASGYTMDSLGRVFTKGLIKNGATADNAVIFNVPAGYRPSEYMHLPTTSNNLFDATGVDTFGPVVTKGVNLNAYRSINHIFYPSGTASWSNLTLQNGWVYYSTPFTYPQYTKGADGIVKLKGLLRSGTTTSGTVVATLPAGYRPSMISLQSEACATVYCRFDVLPNGNIITRDNVSSAWSSLDAITFLAEQ